jgi:hypothetical protein
MAQSLADAFDSGRFVTEANIRRCECRLADARDEAMRGQVTGLLAEERAKLATGRVALWYSRLAIFAEFVDEATAVTGAGMGNIQVVGPATGASHIVANRGFDLPFLNFFAVVRNDCDSACGAALKRAERIIVPDIDQSPIFAGKLSGEVLRAAGVRAVQSTPVFGRAGSLLGMISSHWRSLAAPSDDQLRRLDLMIPRVVTAIGIAIAPDVRISSQA